MPHLRATALGLPGSSYSLSFRGVPGESFSFVTMFVPSNDLIWATAGTGIPLFGTDGQPTSGDVTSMVIILDAGTELNQTPGLGGDQVHLQPAPNTGADDTDANVRAVDDGFTYPAVSDVLTVTITSG